MDKAFETACRKAYDYYDKMKLNGLCACKDIGNEWLFEGGNPKETNYGLNLITIEKITGSVSTFIFNLENLERLAKAPTVEIPDKYKFVSIA